MKNIKSFQSFTLSESSTNENHIIDLVLRLGTLATMVAAVWGISSLKLKRKANNDKRIKDILTKMNNDDFIKGFLNKKTLSDMDKENIKDRLKYLLSSSDYKFIDSVFNELVNIS